MRDLRWRPADPERMARIGLVATLLIAPLLAYDAVRHGVALGAVPAATLGVVVLVAVLATMVVATGRRGDGLTATFYAWSILGNSALAVLAIHVGGDPRRYGVLYGLVVGAFAVIFPARGQVVLQPTAIASYAIVLVSSDLPWPDVAVQLGMVVALSYVAVEISMRLRAVARAEQTAVEEAHWHAGLAAALSRLASLDPEQLMDRIVDAMVDLGFDVAHIAVLRDGLVVPERHRGFEPGCEPYPIPAGLGLVGRALTHRRTEVVADYLTFEGRLPDRDGVRAAVAVPLVVDDEVIGALVASRATPGEPAGAEVEALEVLATHAGHAIVNARRYELERAAVARLTEIDARRSDFVSNVSHELRTPLTVIHGLGETLATRGDALAEDERRVLLDRLTANSQRLTTMIASLLDLARLDAAGTAVDPVPVSLRPTIAGVVRRLEPLLDGHRVSVDVVDDAVLADPPLLEHVVENLVVNAVRHTPAGSTIDVVAVREGELARVLVRDDGPGIPEDELARLTERFYRGAGTDGGRASGGAGLGLALCEQILAAHGSSLTVSSRVGEGAQFSFTLPLAIPLRASATSVRSPR